MTSSTDTGDWFNSQDNLIRCDKSPTIFWWRSIIQIILPRHKLFFISTNALMSIIELNFSSGGFDYNRYMVVYPRKSNSKCDGNPEYETPNVFVES